MKNRVSVCRAARGAVLAHQLGPGPALDWISASLQSPTDRSWRGRVREPGCAAKDIRLTSYRSGTYNVCVMSSPASHPHRSHTLKPEPDT